MILWEISGSTTLDGYALHIRNSWKVFSINFNFLAPYISLFEQFQLGVKSKSIPAQRNLELMNLTLCATH